MATPRPRPGIKPHRAQCREDRVGARLSITKDQTKSDGDFNRLDENGLLHGLDMTCLFNSVAQCPALSVASGLTASGLPTATQIVGRRFDDPTVLRIGKATEATRPWADGLRDLGKRYANQLTNGLTD